MNKPKHTPDDVPNCGTCERTQAINAALLAVATESAAMIRRLIDDDPPSEAEAERWLKRSESAIRKARGE